MNRVSAAIGRPRIDRRTGGGTGGGGFTLIEMLVTTAMCTLLMVAVLQVVASIGDVREPDALALEPLWQQRMHQRLASDLAQARTVELDRSGRLRIEGWCGLAQQDGSAMHRPVAVDYTFDARSGRVVRRQVDRLAPANEVALNSLLVAGVRRWEVRAEGGGAGGDEADGAAVTMPEAVRIHIVFRDADRPPVQWEFEL